MSDEFELVFEVLGPRGLDKDAPEWQESVKRQEEIRRNGLEALSRIAKRDGQNPTKPYFSCYSLDDDPIREYAFQSFDDVMSFAQLLSLCKSRSTYVNREVTVQIIRSYAERLAYVLSNRRGLDPFSMMPRFFMGVGDPGHQNPVSLDVIRGLANKTIMDSDTLRKRRHDKERKRRERLPKFRVGSEILLPGLPDKWYAWPITIELRFALMDGEGVYKGLYWKYDAQNMLDALDILFDESNRGLGLHYNFKAHEFYAGIKWYVDWPLRRRGPANVIPLKDHAFQDDTIFEIYNERSDSAGNRRVIRLKAGGSTRKEAVDNWMQTAQVIRNLL